MIALFDILPRVSNQLKSMDNFVWDDKAKNGEIRHTIWKPDGSWNSIRYSPEIPEMDRLHIDLAFNQLYYTNDWFASMLDQPNTGVFVRNGFHINRETEEPHITFRFQQYGDTTGIQTSHFHAYFDKKTRLIVGISFVEVKTIFRR